MENEYKRVYICGRITGVEEQAKEQFRKAEIKIRKKGFIPVNPMTLPHNHDKEWVSYMKECIRALMTCDEIYVLRGYEKSEGAKIEIYLALGLKIKLNYEY